MDLHAKLNQDLLSILYKPESNNGVHWIMSYISWPISNIGVNYIPVKYIQVDILNGSTKDNLKAIVDFHV